MRVDRFVGWIRGDTGERTPTIVVVLDEDEVPYFVADNELEFTVDEAKTLCTQLMEKVRLAEAWAGRSKNVVRAGRQRRAPDVD